MELEALGDMTEDFEDILKTYGHLDAKQKMSSTEKIKLKFRPHASLTKGPLKRTIWAWSFHFSVGRARWGALLYPLPRNNCQGRVPLGGFSFFTPKLHHPGAMEYRPMSSLHFPLPL